MRAFVLGVGLLVVACAGRARPNTFVRLERTECLGDCPVYRVTLYQGGAVEYVGGAHAPPGTAWRQIAAAEVERLMTAVEQVAPWHCPPDRIVTDYPQSIVTVSRAGRQRRIVHDHGDPCAPRPLLGLEGEIDRAGGHPQLVPTQ